jgi:hypothetical protein
MQNKWMFIVLVLANLLCSYSFNAFSQEARQVNQTNQASTPTEETMLLVAARITEVYHADAGTVESFIRAAVRLESRTGVAAPVVIAIAINESLNRLCMYCRWPEKNRY